MKIAVQISQLISQKIVWGINCEILGVAAVTSRPMKWRTLGNVPQPCFGGVYSLSGITIEFFKLHALLNDFRINYD